MGLMDKAKAAATDLAAKAGSSGEADRYFRDLGVLAYLEASGRPSSPEDRERVMEALRGMETRGAIGSLTLQTSGPPSGTVPPPPGGAAAAPPPPGGIAAPPPPPAPPSATAPPPPPPPWMSKDDTSS